MHPYSTSGQQPNGSGGAVDRQPMSETSLFLDALPDDERTYILNAAETLRYRAGDVLHEAGSRIVYVEFPVRAVASLVIDFEDGRAVEGVSIGREGVVGFPHFLGTDVAYERAVIQVPGTSIRVRATIFDEGMPLPAFRRHLDRFFYAAMFSMNQSAACLAFHTVAERCARWLLTMADRTGSEQFRLTQEGLAAMLGSHRPTVTLAARALQNAGLIRYHRGLITIIDGPGLEAASCECYAAIVNVYARLLASPVTQNRLAPDEPRFPLLNER